MTRREQWRLVLDSELRRWSEKSYEQLVAEWSNDQAYEIEIGSEKFQVEVELLENTETYVNVIVAVDDGTLPASIFTYSGNVPTL